MLDCACLERRNKASLGRLCVLELSNLETGVFGPSAGRCLFNPSRLLFLSTTFRCPTGCWITTDRNPPNTQVLRQTLLLSTQVKHASETPGSALRPFGFVLPENRYCAIRFEFGGN